MMITVGMERYVRIFIFILICSVLGFLNFEYLLQTLKFIFYLFMNFVQYPNIARSRHSSRKTFH